MINRVTVALLVTAMLVACGSPGRSDRTDERFARPGEPKTSPSGDYSVSVDMGPEQNGVETWVAVIRDNKTGAEVFRDTEAYSTRFGVGITWLSTSDQLWLLSTDVGISHADRQEDGTWIKNYIYPETVNQIPDEIKAIQHR